MKYLLDTDTVSFALRGVGAVGERLRGVLPADTAISSVTEAELWFGVEKRGSEKLRRIVSAFVHPMTVLPFESRDARRFGQLRAGLVQKGTPIGVADTMIAAVALCRGLVLVTGNAQHFANIEGLVLEDWQ